MHELKSQVKKLSKIKVKKRSSEFDVPQLNIRGFGHFQYNADEDGHDFEIGNMDLFISSQVAPKLKLFSELVIEFEEDNEQEIDAERLILKYEYADWLNISVGRGHTAIGYWNHTFHQIRGIRSLEALKTSTNTRLESAITGSPLRQLTSSIDTQIPGSPSTVPKIGERCKYRLLSNYCTNRKKHVFISQSKLFFKKLLFFALKGVFLIFLTYLPPDLCSASEIVAIVNKDLNLKKPLSISELRLIFQGRKKTWDTGESILIILPSPNSKPMSFLVSKIFRFNNEGDLSRFYLMAVFRQVFINPPKAVIDIDYTIAEVAAAAGGIALVEIDKIPPGSNINVVRLK